MKHWRTRGPMIAYAMVCAVLQPWFWHKLNPDTLSYFTMARLYTQGEWMEAVNTGWSPLISWLMSPLMLLGVGELAAMQWLDFVSGLVVLYAVGKLSEEFELAGWWQQATMYTAAFMVAVYMLLFSGPDLLEAALLLLYLRTVMPAQYAVNGRGWVAGAWGAAAYLTKGYALYFFLGHFAVTHLLHAWRNRGQVGFLGRQWATGMAVFIALIAPWLTAMAVKTGGPTLGTTGSWNYRLVGPDSPSYPQYYGLIPPVSEHSASMWDQPNPELLPEWSPIGGRREMLHQARLIYRNVQELIRIALYTSILILAIVGAYAVWGLGRQHAARLPWIFPMLTLMVYPVGYLLITVVDRYLWAVFLLVLLMGATVVQDTAQGLRRAGALLLAAIYFLSFLLVPARQLLAQAGDASWAGVAEQIEAETDGLAGARMAACGGWNDSLQISWMLGMPFYGVTGPTAGELEIPVTLNPNFPNIAPPEAWTDAELAQQLNDFQIEYFLVLSACPAPPAAVLEGEQVWEGQDAQLYRLRP